MKRLDRIVAAVALLLVETLALHSPTVSLWLWTATALILVRRAMVLNERTHLVLSVWADVLAALGAVVLALLAWRGYTLFTFPGRWLLCSGIWMVAALGLTFLERRTKRTEWLQVAEAVAEAALWDFATGRDIPDLRCTKGPPQRLGT